MKKTTLFALFIGLCLSAMAQLNSADPQWIFVDGFVVKSSGDTLWGKVSCKGAANQFVNKISYRSDPNKKDETPFTPEDAIAFGQKRQKALKAITGDLSDNRGGYAVYVKMENPKKPGTMVFMEQVVNGKISVYSNPTGAESSQSIGGFKVNEDESTLYIKKADAKMFLMKKKDFEKNFDTLFGDCPAVMDLIKKEPKKKNFSQMDVLLDTYNKNCGS